MVEFSFGDTTMANIIELEQTCESYPVQYWARKGAHIIGYIRLRWGHLSCDYLLSGNLKGDRIRLVDHYFNDKYKGEFDNEEEQNLWLDKCKSELLSKYNELNNKK